MNDNTCKFCGRELFENCKYCPECGRPVVISPVTAENFVSERTDRDIGEYPLPSTDAVSEREAELNTVQELPEDDPVVEDLPEEKKSKGKRPKKKMILLSILIVFGGLILTVCTMILCGVITFEPVDKPEKIKKPESTAEIVDFYDKAVELVKENGQAGYSEKEWQTMSGADITGISLVDEILSFVVEKNIISESSAKKVSYSAGTQEAKDAFPDFTLPDTAQISSAELTEMNGNYLINLTFGPENEPQPGTGTLSRITDSVIYKDGVVVPILDSISSVKSYDGLNVGYESFAITCEITPDGRFLSLKHYGKAVITIDEVRLHLVPITDIKVNVETNALYQDFEYEKNDRA